MHNAIQVKSAKRHISIQLNASLRYRLSQQVVNFLNTSPGLSFSDQVKRAHIIFNDVFDSNSDNFKISKNKNFDSIHISGLPEYNGECSDALYRMTLLIISSAIGIPFQYIEQHSGNIIPCLRVKKDSKANSNSSADDFGAHSDDAFMEEAYRTTWIGLLGKKNLSETPTGFAHIEDIADQLSSESLELLKQPLFIFRQPFSFDDGNTVIYSEPRPIIYLGNDKKLRCQCPTYNTKCANTEAEGAFQQFVGATNKCMSWVTVHQGEAFFFKNSKGLHARKAIKGLDNRAIFRIYLKDNLNALRKISGDPHGHIFSTRRILEAANDDSC